MVKTPIVKCFVEKAKSGSGLSEARRVLLNYFDPKNEIVDVLREVCEQPADPSLIANAAGHIALRSPERLAEAAGYIAKQTGKARSLSLAEIRRRTPERANSELARTLGLA